MLKSANHNFIYIGVIIPLFLPDLFWINDGSVTPFRKSINFWLFRAQFYSGCLWENSLAMLWTENFDWTFKNFSWTTIYNCFRASQKWVLFP